MTNALHGLATHILPLFGVILLAWMVGARVPKAPKLISTVLVYVLIPVLVIDKVLGAEPGQLAVIPPIMFAVAALMAWPAHRLSRRIGDRFDPPLLSASFSFFNVAFFGMPVASALFGEAAISTIVCAFVGTALYGDTIGYYLVARTAEGKRRAAAKALRIPLFYAFVLAVILKLAEVEVPDGVRPVADTLSMVVSVLGMAVIGFNLSAVRAKDIDWPLMGRILAVRQASAIALVALALALEASVIHVLGRQERILVGVIGLFPIAANISLFASLLGTREKEAATLVALSTVLSLLLVIVAVVMLGATGAI